MATQNGKTKRECVSHSPIFISMNKEISPNKRYSFPDNLSIVRRNGNILIISVETAKWIVLKNESQLSFFELLQIMPLGEALERFEGHYNDAQYMVIQLEARHFEDQNVHSCIYNEVKTLQLYLTNACNLRCPHCYMFAGQKSKNELSTEEIFSVIDGYKGQGGEKVTLTGGEVTMRKDLAEIVRYASNAGLKVRILTNGTAWNPELIDNVSPYLSSVQISIDGFSEKTNAKVRGAGSFSISLSALDRFISNNVPSEVSVTPYYDDDFESYVESFADFAKSLTTKYAGKKFKINFAEQMMEGREVSLNETQQRQYSNVINKIHEKYFGADTEDLSFVKAFREAQIMDNCMYGVISISSTGDVYFCARIPSISSIGNVRTMGFDEIMEMSRLAQSQSNINNLAPCKDCNIKYICGGGCRIDYFPELTSSKDIKSLDISKIHRIPCEIEEKERYYDIMIRTNEKLFQ